MKKFYGVLRGVSLPLLVLICFLLAPVLNQKPETSSTAESVVAVVPEVDMTQLTPSPEPTPEPFQEYDITLLALGDNLMHMGVINTGKQADGSYDYSFLFQGISDFLEQSDIQAINQETILGGNQLGFSGFPHFNSPTEVGDAIATAGFDVVLHATNHAADQGIDGIKNCVDFWETTYPDVLMSGINYDTEFSADAAANVASTADIPLLTVKDVTFAFLNYTYGPNMEVLPNSIRGHLNMLCAYNEANGAIDFTSLNPQVISDIQAAKELADIVIVFPHWGTEYQDTQSSYQEKFAQEMTAAGADLIIGTHPHVPQPVEWITAENGNRSLCYYSLGNYVSTQKQALCMLEEMAWITFHVTENDVQISESKTGVIPMVCHYNSGPVRVEQVYLLEDYTEEQAASHGIWNYGGVPLHLEDLQNYSQDIFGEWILHREDVLTQ